MANVPIAAKKGRLVEERDSDGVLQQNRNETDRGFERKNHSDRQSQCGQIRHLQLPDG
jgi:hypothetical protein